MAPLQLLDQTCTLVKEGIDLHPFQPRHADGMTHHDIAVKCKQTVRQAWLFSSCLIGLQFN